MLIEALSKLAHNAGAERISIEIPPSDGGECSVIVVTSLGHSARTSEGEKEGAILSALTAPLVVKGNVGELDSRIVALIDEIEDDYRAASAELPETDAQKRKRELNEAVEKKNDKPEQPKAKKGKKGKPAKKEEKVEAVGSDHAEALASGTADTL